MIVREALELGKKTLTHAGIQNPVLDSQVILSFALKIDKLTLLINPETTLSKEQQDQYNKLLALRCRHIPIAYITGHKEFYGLNFQVNSEVLVPRPETEFAVEEVLKHISNIKEPKVADICCGSGAIAVSIAVHHKTAVVYATDISEACGKVTIKNSKYHGVNERVIFLKGNLLEPLKDSCLDVIVSNPPYIPRKDIESLPADVRHEPVLALDGGIDGLDMYREIIKDAPKYLKPGGSIIFEIGWNQGKDVEEYLTTSGFSKIRVIRDYAGFDRVISAKL